MTCPRGCCATYREHLTAVSLGVTSQRMLEDRRESADMDAYRRLRQSGVQPKEIAGSATLEREASTVHEVEAGRILTSAQERRKLVRAFDGAA